MKLLLLHTTANPTFEWGSIPREVLYTLTDKLEWASSSRVNLDTLNEECDGGDYKGRVNSFIVVLLNKFPEIVQLSEVIFERNYYIVKHLMKGEDPNLPFNRKRKTPLSVLLQSPHYKHDNPRKWLKTLRVLLKYGADLNAKLNGAILSFRTPFEFIFEPRDGSCDMYLYTEVAKSILNTVIQMLLFILQLMQLIFINTLLLLNFFVDFSK